MGRRRREVSNVLRNLTQEPRLTLLEENELLRLAKGGDLSAKIRLIEANRWLVLSIATTYVSRSLSFEAVVTAGETGLRMAAERFDPAHGFRFTTYATHWVRMAIGRKIDQAEGGPIRRMLVDENGRVSSIKKLPERFDESE